MTDFKIEDTIVILDVSRSMLRSLPNFKPNRIFIALKVAKNFIQSKLAIDSNDRISVITFGYDINKLIPFSHDEEKLINSFKSFQISGKGQIHKAIAFSLQTIIKEMRKFGGKIQRIFIINDNKLKSDPNKLLKLIKIAKGLNVYIDTCQFGKTQNNQSALKKIAQMTNGEFGFFNNSNAIINAGKSFASKKMTKEATDYFSPDKPEETPQMMSDIALPLRRPSLMELRSMMKGDSSELEKCAICHSKKAPLTDADFYSEGRYCPSCDRAIHLSCAAMWAKKSESKEEDVFRCPFCFFLLTVPKSAERLIQDKKDSKGVKILEDLKETRMIEISYKFIDQIDASCTYCYNIFTGDYKVFKCEKCESYYHEHCLQKMYKEVSACRFCGSEIKF